MGIVDDHAQAGRVAGNQLHTAFRAGDIGQRAKRVMQGKATGMRHNGSRHGIHRLKAAGQRNRHAHDRVSMRDGDVQPEFHRGDRLNMEIGTLCLANRQHNDFAAVITAQLRGKTGPMRIVNIDNGGAARHQQIGEQPRFGSEIGVDIRVMVQMIAAEIGKAGDMHIHAVQTVLFQPVAAGLDRKMGNAGAGQLVQGRMQAQRIRGCQRGKPHHRALHVAAFDPLHAQRADRCGIPGDALPDLAHELHC